MTTYVGFRFDDVHFSCIHKFIAKFNVKCYITQETASNLHWHCLFEIPDVGKTPIKCYKEKVYRFLINKGNDGTKALSDVSDLEKTKRYLSKGEDGETQPHVIYNTLGVDVPKYHKDYWVIWEKKEQDVKDRETRAKTRKTKGMLELLMDYSDMIGVSKVNCKDWMDCRRIVMKYYIINFKVFPEQFMVERMSKTLYIQLQRKWYPDMRLDTLVEQAINLF